MAYNPGNPNSAILLPNAGTSTPFSGYSLPSSSSSAAFLSLQHPNSDEWTWEEHNTLELAILSLLENTPDRWLMIADQIPGKSVAEVFNYYLAMLRDLALQRRLQSQEFDDVAPLHQLPEASTELNGDPAEKKNKKRKLWTESEHKLFLEGLRKHGKGDWKRISLSIASKSSTQVASHAQKYFLHQAKKTASNRSSIHDITTVDGDNGDAAEDQVMEQQAPPQSPWSLPPLPPCLKFEGMGNIPPNHGSLQNDQYFHYQPYNNGCI